jgi:DNA-binding SARP family transcriptional activator
MAWVKGSKKTDGAEQLTVCAFGGLSFYFKEAPISISWESQKARLLFCYLLVTYDQWVHRDKIIELLWPGGDDGAAVNNFKTTLSRLRKSFAGSHAINPVLTQGEAVRINFSVIALDASQFRQKATTGIKLLARGDHKAAKTSLEAAQDIYVGDFLPEEPFNECINATRAELAELNVAVVVSLGKIYQAEGNHDAMEAILMLKKGLVADFS